MMFNNCPAPGVKSPTVKARRTRRRSMPSWLGTRWATWVVPDPGMSEDLGSSSDPAGSDAEGSYPAYLVRPRRQASGP